MELKAATQEAVQQTKQAFAAEAKLVARDMVDFKVRRGIFDDFEAKMDGKQVEKAWKTL